MAPRTGSPTPTATVSVSVKYSKPGTQPPIYLAGSFSDPAWQPQEMQYTTDESHEHSFVKEVKVEAGKEYQYKFRIGLGDWWVLNEDSPTGTDAAGNRNNLLIVPVAHHHHHHTTVSKSPEVTPQEAPSTEMEESSEHNLPVRRGARQTTPDQVEEEAMGTRETSDVLFSDEITNDVQEPKSIISKPLTSELPERLEPLDPSEPLAPHPTPALEIEQAKADFVEDREETREDDTDLSEGVEPAAHAPTVVAEKGDDGGLGGGDDSGPDATPAAHKDAHNARAQDAEPDETIIRGAHTPELADVAAEVADVAETLDRDAPTPPISNEEAGRIGYRRMSNTPIPEVADTAAEVADVAATLDEQDLAADVAATLDEQDRADVAPAPLGKQELGDLLEARGYFAIMEDESIVFPETPPDEKVPLFPHERGESPSPSGSRPNHPVDIPRRISRQEEPAAAVYDPNDPTIQPFPEDREGIMRQLASMQRRLPPDTADYVGGLVSHTPEEIDGPASSGSHLHDRSLSLDPITEENDEEKGLLTNGGNVNGDGLATLSEVEEADEDELEQPQAQVNGVEEIAGEPIQTEPDNTPTPTIVVDGAVAASAPEVEGATGRNREPLVTHSIQRSLDGGADDDAAPVETPAEVPAVENHNTEPPANHAIDRSVDGREDMPLLVSSARIPATPLIVGNRQLGHEEEEVQNITIPSGVSIKVQPATPRGSTADPDVGKTTAFEDKNASSQIKSRKRQPSPTHDRPLTPSSMRGKEQSKGFLRAFWRVVFVEWIGGLIMRLCSGGRGRQTLLAVGAFAILASAPAMYKFFLTRLAEFRIRIP